MPTVLDSWYRNHPLIFAHRGASAYAPMNTLPAFELAVEQGADGIELDVHRSRDGHAVVVHDYSVDSTTDGSGRVTDMNLAELKAFDAGGWFGEAFRGTSIPTLDEVFEAVGQQVYVNVEIKSESAETDGVEQVVAEVITRHSMQERVLISSFNPLTLKRMRDLMPMLPIAFLTEENMHIDTEAIMDQLGLTHEARHPRHSMVNEKYIAWAKHMGFRVHTWTVNDPARAIELRDLGVDGIFTDYPDTILRAVRGA